MVVEKFFGKYRFLSNFWPCNVIYDGVEYPSTEHAYQAAKTLDKDVREKIRIAKTADAKKLGQTVKIRDDWEQVKVLIMWSLIDQKFNDEELSRKLAETGSDMLIEGNTWGDRYWGVCNGEGQNILGQLLMIKRNLL